MGAKRNVLKVGLVFSCHGSSEVQLREYVGKLENLTRDKNFHCFRYPEKNPFIFLYFDPTQQPALKSYFHEDGSFLVLDGEVYNLHELAPENGARRHDEAATMFDLYRSQGDGAFGNAASILIWDSRQERLVILRDRWGAVPGFYKEKNGILCWSSKLPGLLKVAGYEGVNLPAMDYYLGSGHIPAPWTLARGISKVQPAHLLSASRRASTRIERYWRPTGQPKLDLRPDQTTERLGNFLKQSLRRRVNRDE